MFETNFSGHNKIWEDKNKVGVTAPEWPPWLRACYCNRRCR